MIKYIIAGIIGIVIYQIIATIIYVATKENDEILSIVAMLVPYGVFIATAPIIRKIYLMWCKKHLNGYRFCDVDKDGKTHRSISLWFATDKAVANLTQDETQPYFITKEVEGKHLKKIPYKDEIYRGQDSFQGRKISNFLKNNV